MSFVDRLLKIARSPRWLILAIPLVTLAAADLPAELVVLRTKALAGNAVAQYDLGVAFFDGQDIAANPAEAYVWLSLAAENGATGKALEALLVDITPEQLAEGKTRLAAQRATVAGQKDAAKPALAQIDRAELVRLREERELALRDKQRLSTELTVAQTKLAQVQSALAEATTRADSAGKDTALKTTVVSGLQGRLDDALLALRNAKVTADASATQSAVREKELADLRTRLKSAEASAAQAGATSARTADLEQQITRLQQELAALRQAAPVKTANDGVAARLATLTTEANEVKKAHARLSTESATLADQANSGASESAAKSTEITALPPRLTTVESELADAKKLAAPTAVAAQPAGEAKPAIALKETPPAAEKRDAAPSPRTTESVGRIGNIVKTSVGAPRVNSGPVARPSSVIATATEKSALPVSSPTVPAGTGPATPQSTVGQIVVPPLRSAPTRPANVVVPAPAPAAPPPPEIRTHVVVAGDTLSKLARKYYNNGERWPEILAANRARIPNGDKIIPGLKLVIP